MSISSINGPGPPRTAAPARRPEPERALAELRQKLEAATANTGYGVSFARDERSGQTIIRIVDRDSGEVLRQFPSEELLKVKQVLSELIGLIVDRRL